jgi:hypothetical protein
MAVLVAEATPGRERLARILDGRDVEFASTCVEARVRLRERPYELIVIGAHFDSSTALELVQEVLRGEAPCPVICVHCMPFRTPSARRSFDAFRLASSALGAAEVLNLLEFPDDEAGNARVRTMLERLMAAGR